MEKKNLEDINKEITSETNEKLRGTKEVLEKKNNNEKTESSKAGRSDKESEKKQKIEQVEESKSSTSNKKEKKQNQKKPSKIKVTILVILGLLTIISGAYYYKLVVKYKNLPPQVIAQEEQKSKEIVKENVTLYVPSEGNETLEKKQMEIVVGSTEEERVKNILSTLKEELNYNLKYTDEEGKVVEIPFLKDEVQLLDVYFDGSDVYLNMNYHFRENMKVISQEIIIIYSIVNTLTEDSRYKRVKFLINDKEVDQLNFYKLSNFYERNLEI